VATFGFTSIGSDDTGLTNPAGCKFVAPASGTITSIYVYISNIGVIGEPIRCAVYSDSSGSPGAKLAESSETAVPALSLWYPCVLSLAITNGVTYWLMAWGIQGTKHNTPGDVTDQAAYMTGNTYPTWPDPFNESAFLDRKMSIYAEYTPAATGQPAIKRLGGVIHAAGASPLASRRW
jgi:hypothetical protein